MWKKICYNVFIFFFFVMVLSIQIFFLFQINTQAVGESSTELLLIETLYKDKKTNQDVQDTLQIVFVGDIMFDRQVEKQIQTKGQFFLFEKIESFLREFDLVIGNLEGPIVKKAPDFGVHSMQFAFDASVLESLSFAHFDVVSLANNHTQNMGSDGLEETRDLLNARDILSVGDPIDCQIDPMKELNEPVILFAFNQTFPFNCSNQAIVKIIEDARNSFPNYFFIIFMHWGNEYEPKSSLIQQEAAHAFINAGADLIIGSHPHVVQEIELYKNKLIFYSLGNFIFDQYFSKETQENLALAIKLTEEHLQIDLISLDSHLSQPFIMEEVLKNLFLENLSKKSDKHLYSQIENGSLIINK